MQVPVQVTFQDVPPSAALEDAVRAEAASLERCFDRVTSCHVTISEPHRHRHTGRLYSVHVRLLVPGEELIVGREHRLHAGHADPYLAVRETFHAARRELEDYVRRMRGDVKRHERPHGLILRLLPWDDHGFIETPDGRELYFHRNSLLGGNFDELRLGNEVTFVEEEAQKGPNATSVRLVRGSDAAPPKGVPSC